jgi:hypothetical protein
MGKSMNEPQYSFKGKGPGDLIENITQDHHGLGWTQLELLSLTKRHFYGKVTLIIENGMIQRMEITESKKR